MSTPSTETLECTVCGDQWERERKRGRKPTKCPECAAGNTKVKAPTPAAVEPQTDAGDDTDTDDTDDTDDGSDDTKTELHYIDDSLNRLHERTANADVKFEGDAVEHRFHDSFESATIDGEAIAKGDIVRVFNETGQYVVRSICRQRDDQFPYAEIVGRTGMYQGKYRAVGLDRIKL